MSKDPEDWSVGQATLEDAGMVAALIAAAFAEVARRFGLDHDNCPSHPSLITQDRIELGFQLGTVFLLASADGRPVGCIGVRPPAEGVSTLEKLAIAPAFRRRGLGRTLVGHGTSRAHDLGAREVEVGIIAEEHDLRAWYESLGFRPTRTARFDHLPFEVLYLRKLTSAPGR